MKVGQRVYVKERKSFGKITQADAGVAVKVKLDNGEIINVFMLTVEIISKLKIFINAIKKIFTK